MRFPRSLRAALVCLATLAAMGCTASLPTAATPSSAAPGSTSATTVGPTDAGGSQVRDVSVRSKAMKRSVMVRIILPAPASSAPSSGWPVVYLLHGSSDNYTSWSSVVEPSLPAMAAAAGVIVAMPDGGSAGYYSNWNSGKKWETFHLTELPAYLRAHFPANTNRAAIGGYSMGGFGALSYAARHPGRFRAVVALSPVANPLRDPNIVLFDVRDAYGSASRYKLWGNPVSASGKKTWKAHDPYYLASGLRKTFLFLSAGTGSDAYEPYLRAETLRLITKLNRLGTKKLGITLVTHTDYPGTHAARFWSEQFDFAWPRMINALKK